MNVIESLKNDIELSKEWKGSSREVLNQITIMEALIVLLKRSERESQKITQKDVGTFEL